MAFLIRSEETPRSKTVSWKLMYFIYNRNGKHPLIILGNQGTYFEYLNRIDLKIHAQNNYQENIRAIKGIMEDKDSLIDKV